MRALALASLLTPILLVAACATPEPSSPIQPQLTPDGEDRGVHAHTPLRTSRAESGSLHTLDHCLASENRVRQALGNAEHAGAASQLRIAIDEIMAEGRLNSADPRIDVLDRLSTLADRIGEMTLAERAWTRVCESRLCTYLPESDHERLMVLDQHFASNHRKPQVVEVVPPESRPALPVKVAVEAAAPKPEREEQRRQLLARVANEASSEDPNLIDELTLLHDRDRAAHDPEAALASLGALKTVCDRQSANDDPALRAARMKVVDRLRAENLLVSAADLMEQAVDSLERLKPEASKELADALQIQDEILAESERQAARQAELVQALAEPASSASRDDLRDLVARRSKELVIAKRCEAADRLAGEIERALPLLAVDEPRVVESKERLAGYYERSPKSGAEQERTMSTEK